MRHWLKKLRGDTSEQDIANKLGITQQYYHLIETGKRQKKMELALCEKIAKVFNLSVHKIVDFEIERMQAEQTDTETS